MQKHADYNIIPVKNNIFNNIGIAIEYIKDIKDINKEKNFNIITSELTLKTELLLNNVGDIELLRGIMFSKKLFTTIKYMDIFNITNIEETINVLFNRCLIKDSLFNVSNKLLDKNNVSYENNEINYGMINSFNNIIYSIDTIKVIDNNIFILVEDDIFNNITNIIEIQYMEQVNFKESIIELFKVYLNTLTFNKEIVSNNNNNKIILNLNEFYLKNT